MGTTSLTIGNEYLSTTMHVLHADDIKDGLGLAHGLLDAWKDHHGEGKPIQEGGTRYVIPVMLAEHSGPTDMTSSGGYGEIDLSAADATRPAVFTPAHSLQPVVISMEEEYTNAGKPAIIKMADVRRKCVLSRMKRDFIKQIVDGNVTGWTNWGTLNGVDRSTGYLEEDAVTAQDNSVGGLSKATYSGTTGWRNQRYDGAGSFNSNGLAGMYDAGVEIDSLGQAEDGRIILASKAAFKNLKRALQAYERYIDESVDGGRKVQLWDGHRIYVEPQLPNAGSATTADPISFYFVDPKGIYPLWDKFFELGDFADVAGNYDIRSAKMRCRGQLVSGILGTSACIVDLDTF